MVKQPKFGSEQLLSEAYSNMQAPAQQSRGSRQDFIDFYNQYQSIFFENCELQPGEMQRGKQVYRYSSGSKFVGRDTIYCNILGYKPVLHNESVGSKRIPLVSNKHLMFKDIVVTYKLPESEAKTVYYTL